MAFFNLKKPSPTTADDSIQSIMPDPAPKDHTDELLFNETPTVIDENLPVEPEDSGEKIDLSETIDLGQQITIDELIPEEKAKKKSILTMDIKDLFRGKKKEKPEDEDEEEVTEPKPKINLLTMDIKDLAQLKPKSKKGRVKRSKRIMNFVRHESNFNLMKVLPAVLVIMAASAAFVQVGFLDMLDQKTAAYSQLATKQEQLAAVNTRLVGYDELAAEYGRYSYGWMSSSEVSMVNRLDVLNLVEEQIVPYSKVENISVSGNALTMNIYEITLEEASAMVKRLEEHPLVATAVIYSANAPEATQARIFLSINLTKEAR